MKSKHPINSRMFVVALALVPIVQATPRLHGGPTHPPANEAPRFDGGPDHAAAVITVHSTGDVTRGKVSRATVSAGVQRGDARSFSCLPHGTLAVANWDQSFTSRFW